MTEFEIRLLEAVESIAASLERLSGAVFQENIQVWDNSRRGEQIR